MFKIYLIIVAVMSFITFILYYVDKRKAIKKEWRIKEAVLLGCSILGGALGGFTAMYAFHHKTKHWYFVLINIVGLALQAYLGYYLFTH